MRTTWTPCRRRRWLAAALVTLAAGVAAAPAPAAKSTSQRLRALEAQAAALTRATNSLSAQHKALATAQTSLVNSYASLNARYTGFVGCLRRTPLFSYDGYAWDSDGNGVADTTTRGLDWYVTGGGSVPTGVPVGREFHQFDARPVPREHRWLPRVRGLPQSHHLRIRCPGGVGCEGPEQVTALRPRRLAMLGLLMLCFLGGALSAPAEAKSTSQRVQSLERRLTHRARVLAALQRDTERLVRAHNELLAQMNALNTRYTALSACVQRTPLRAWAGYVFNGTSGFTMLDWFAVAGTTNTQTIHGLGLGNTQPCLDTVAFYNPRTGAGATAGFGAKTTQERTP